MKRLIPLILAMALLLSGCGYDTPDPAAFGYYAGTTIWLEGYEINMTDVYAGENYVFLGNDGKGTLCLAGFPYEITWGFRGERFFLSLDGDKSEGRIENGVLKLNYLDMGMDLCFRQDPDYVPGQSADGELTRTQQFWAGDWYGWWIVEEATGSFAENAGSWWDLCATITMGSDNLGKITLWDQDGSKEELLGEVYLYLDENGAAVSRNGYFGAVEIQRGDWYIDPNDSGVENMLVISGGGENNTGTFYYTAYLRPWGQDWEGVQEKPYHYEEWSLPMIEEGQPMPDQLPQ